MFLDYQNVYRRARSAFFDQDAPSSKGQIDPLRLGQLLAARSKVPRDLHQVRVYRGEPSNARDPKGYAASQRQMAAWAQQSQVEVISRTLKYRAGHPPEEKGIDVHLAVDFITMALTGEYEVGIIFSEDTDLLPALEAVLNLKGTTGITCEVAAWVQRDGARRGLRLKQFRLWCHHLSQDDYLQVADPTSYTLGEERKRGGRKS